MLLVCRLAICGSVEKVAQPADPGLDLAERAKQGPKSEVIWTPFSDAHLAAGAASKSVKLQRPARATVCSHSLKGRVRQCGAYFMNSRSPKVVKIARLLDAAGRFGVDQVLKIAQLRIDKRAKAAAIRLPPFYSEFRGLWPVDSLGRSASLRWNVLSEPSRGCAMLTSFAAACRRSLSSRPFRGLRRGLPAP